MRTTPSLLPATEEVPRTTIYHLLVCNNHEHLKDEMCVKIEELHARGIMKFDIDHHSITYLEPSPIHPDASRVVQELYCTPSESQFISGCRFDEIRFTWYAGRHKNYASFKDFALTRLKPTGHAIFDT